MIETVEKALEITGIKTNEDRKQILEAIRYVDEVILPSDTRKNIINILRALFDILPIIDGFYSISYMGKIFFFKAL